MRKRRFASSRIWRGPGMGDCPGLLDSCGSARRPSMDVMSSPYWLSQSMPYFSRTRWRAAPQWNLREEREARSGTCVGWDAPR
jgi:hypothetical protein